MIASKLQHQLTKPVTAIKHALARNKLAQLTQHSSETVQKISSALLEAIDKTFTAEELAWITQIEKRRLALHHSNEMVQLIDYGAGSPFSKRTMEEMDKGVPSSAKLSKIAGASKSPFWATVLYKLIRKMQPTQCLELGTCVGLSASYQAAALTLNRKGHLVTLEGSPEVASIAQETIQTLGLSNVQVITGPFHQTLNEVLAAHAPIDYFFNDGHHNHDAVLRYFKQVLPYLSPGALMVIDDISWSPGMRKAWKSIESDQHIALSFRLQTIGIAVVGERNILPSVFSIPL